MKSFLIKLIDGYEYGGLGRHFASFSYSGSVSSKNRKNKRAGLHRVGEKLASFFAATRTTCYGAFFVSLGLSVLLFYFLNEYAGAYEGRNFVTLALGAISSIISIPLLLIDKPWHRMMSESRLLSYVFFDFFCMKRGWSPDGKRGMPTVLGVILGVFIAALGILAPVGNIALAIGTLVLIYLSFSSPEFPYLLSLLLIPYSSYIPNAAVALAFLSVLSFVAFFKKAVSGKRVSNIEQYDVILFVMLILVCIYAYFTRENAKITDYFIIISLFMGYYLASNVITNRRLADSISNGFVVTALPLAIYMDVVKIVSLAGGAPSPAPSVEFLLSSVVCAVLTLRLVKHASGIAKTVYLVLLFIYVLSVGLMMQPLLAIALVIGMLTAALYRAGKYFPLLISPVCLLIGLLHLLPEGARESVLKLIGVDSPTLAEQLLASPVGVAIFVFTILLLIVRVRHRIVYWSFFEGTHLTSISVGYAGATVALMLMVGISADMLTGYSLYLLLSLFGMGSAALRVAKRESDNAELYFVDTKSIDSSTVNILIH